MQDENAVANMNMIQGVMDEAMTAVQCRGQNYSAILPDIPHRDAPKEEYDQVINKLTSQLKSEYNAFAKRSIEWLFDLGEYLTRLRDCFKQYHGIMTFESYVKIKLGWSRRQAYNYIQCFERLRCANFAKASIDHSALFALAAPGTPREVVDKFIYKAQQGESISHKDVQEEIKKRKMLKSEPLEELPRGMCMRKTALDVLSAARPDEMSNGTLSKWIASGRIGATKKLYKSNIQRGSTGGHYPTQGINALDLAMEVLKLPDECVIISLDELMQLIKEPQAFRSGVAVSFCNPDAHKDHLTGEGSTYNDYVRGLQFGAECSKRITRKSKAMRKS